MLLAAGELNVGDTEEDNSGLLGVAIVVTVDNEVSSVLENNEVNGVDCTEDEEGTTVDIEDVVFADDGICVDRGIDDVIPTSEVVVDLTDVCLGTGEDLVLTSDVTSVEEATFAEVISMAVEFIVVTRFVICSVERACVNGV